MPRPRAERRSTGRRRRSLRRSWPSRPMGYSVGSRSNFLSRTSWVIGKLTSSGRLPLSSRGSTLSRRSTGRGKPTGGALQTRTCLGVESVGAGSTASGSSTSPAAGAALSDLGRPSSGATGTTGADSNPSPERSSWRPWGSGWTSTFRRLGRRRTTRRPDPTVPRPTTPSPWRVTIPSRLPGGRSGRTPTPKPWRAGS